MLDRNTLIRTLLISSLMLFGAQAQADLIITTATPSVENGDSAGCQADPNCAGKSGTSKILAYLTGTISDFGEELYKSDIEGGVSVESGPFDEYYNTIFSNTPSSPSDALIDWIGRYYMGDARYLLIKDGDHSPIWYLFDIKAWDGKMDILISGFWPDNGSISHVSIYGGTLKLPEPGSLALLGIGLFGIGLARLRKRT